MAIPLLPCSGPLCTVAPFQLPVLRVTSTLRLMVYRQSVHLGDKPLETHNQHFFQQNTCGYSPYVTSSLMKGWVCRLQLLLVLASAVILRSEPRGTHDHFYCLRFETPPIWRAKSPCLYPPATGWSGYTPRHCSTFFSFYGSQGHGEGIRTRLHTVMPILALLVLLITPLRGPSRKYLFQRFLYCCMRIRYRGNVFT
jgi:hypothetical protein